MVNPIPLIDANLNAKIESVLPVRPKFKSYVDFLLSKQRINKKHGLSDYTIPSMLHPYEYKDHQKFCIETAIKKGRFGIYAGLGLGKTNMMLSIGQTFLNATKKSSLIVAPKAICLQTIDEAMKFFGITVKFITTKNISESLPVGFYISNYEQVKRFTKEQVNQFHCVNLDESSRLKGHNSQTRTVLTDLFKETPYKFNFSATPSPNELVELVNQATFLGIINDNRDAIAEYFRTDHTTQGHYVLKEDAKDAFWTWVTSWCLMFNKPSALGFSDFGYDLPEVNYVIHRVGKQLTTLDDLKNQSFASSTNLKKFWDKTLDERLDLAERLVNGRDRDTQFLLWGLYNNHCDLLEDKVRTGALNRLGKSEGDKLDKYQRFNTSVIQVGGTRKENKDQSQLFDFAKNEVRTLVTKTKIASMGLNFQQAHNMIFFDFDFSFEQLFQGIGRMVRFGQKKTVNVHIFAPEDMQNVLTIIQEKRKKHELSLQMCAEYMRKAYVHEAIDIALDYEFKELSGVNWRLLGGDNVETAKHIEDESIDFALTSIPFFDVFRYTNSFRCMGNNKDINAFLTHMEYLLPNILRKLKKGRVFALHVKDVPMYKGSHGVTGEFPLVAYVKLLAFKLGFTYNGLITIRRNAEMEMKKTKTQRLKHADLTYDSTMSSCAMNEYVIILKRWGEKYERVPVQGIAHEDAGHRIRWDEMPSNMLCNPNFPEFQQVAKNGERRAAHTLPNKGIVTAKGGGVLNNMTLEDAKRIYRNYWNYTPKQVKQAKKRLTGMSVDIWQRQAEGIWYIDYKDVLKPTLSKKAIKHICPFPMDIPNRLIHMYSNPGELVWDMFNGVGTSGVASLRLGRKYLGQEFNENYINEAARQLRNEESKRLQGSLF